MGWLLVRRWYLWDAAWASGAMIGFEEEIIIETESLVKL
jgi:hypothetical protein